MRYLDMGRHLVILLLMSAVFSFAGKLHAAQCASVFSGGLTQNLGVNGLDLSGINWASNPWPASGSELQTGDYYFAGGALPDDYKLEVVPGAIVRIFVSGNLTIGANSEFESDGELLLVVQGSLVLGNGVEFEGLIYAGGAVNRSSNGRGNQPEIDGALASAGPNATDRYNIRFDEELAASSLLSGLCTRNVELSANGQTRDPVIVAPDEVVSFSVAAMNCPQAESVARSNEWIDRWSVAGVQIDEFNEEDSPCSRDVTWSYEFSEPGTYVVEYEAEYCSSRSWSWLFGFFFCSEYEAFSSDEIVIEVENKFSGLNCETQDDFQSGALDSDLWVTSSNGAFTPTAVDGRLRMTEASGNQSTAATLQAELPGEGNLVILTFDYFAYGGSGADGLAVVLSDANQTPQPGSYGGSLGYAQQVSGDIRVPGFRGGWLGIGLDEYGNFGNPTEGRQGGQGFRKDSVVIRGSGSGIDGYQFLQGTRSLSPGIDSTGSSTGHTYEITIDSRTPGEAWVSVRRDYGSGMQTLISPFNVLNEDGQANVPENFLLSLTGSTGGSTNIHELDNVQLCALKVNEVGNQVDHFEIEHSGSALTCRPEVVRLRACANAECSERFPEPVEVTLSPSGWVGGNTFTFTGESDPALRITRPTLEPITLGITRSVPGTKPFSQTLCDNGSGVLSAENCGMMFFDSGFDISIPDHVSDTTVPATIAAVRKDDSTEQCVPGFNEEDKNIALWFDYVNPASGSKSIVAGDDRLPSFMDAVRTLRFNENGVATVDIRYPDVGRVRLRAQYDGVGEDEGLEMVGDGTFVARPARFQLEIPGNPAATSVEDGNDFVAAGSDFEIRVSSLNASGNITPNFGRELPAESVALSAALVAPADGQMPSLQGAFGDFGSDCEGNVSGDGTACGQFQWPEVGIISITPSLADGSYMETADVVGDQVPHVGRFIPDRFHVSVSEPGEVEPYCSVSTAFAYMGQGLNWKSGLQPELTLEALNVTGNRTRNYTLGSFQRLEVANLDSNRLRGASDSSAVDINGDPFPVSADLSGGRLSVLEPGVLRYQFASDDEITFGKMPRTRVRPFVPDYLIQLTGVSDADGVSTLQTPVDIRPVFDLEMRYGRLQLENAYGPEISGLEIPFQAEYYTLDGFVTNSSDWCWSYNTGEVSLDQSGLSGGSTAVTGATGTLDEGTSEPGRGVLLTAPGPDNRGDVLVSLPTPLWLSGDFNGDGSLEDPSATATFGVYRGNDRIIYWREVPAN